MPESVSRDPLVWIDCEMTGLDSDHDSIMSIACFITDHDLNMLEPDGFEVFVHHSQERLDQMGEWCKVHHGKSGLTSKCLESSTSAEDAGQSLLQYVIKHVPERRRALLAGNSVHADRMFLSKDPYKRVLRHLHHRLLDVSAIKEAARRWAPAESLKRSPQKAGSHDAKTDILESIAEARYYKEVFFDQERQS
ncbi:MAG: hypothetical protein M1820_007396 [Bogoriella megaspora]|nr:MAG: hypothetical protein M1820_007396 [Bogoriella megaspora]